MLVLTSKKYEVEEPVKVVNESDETLYEFTMQITADEMKQIKDILLDESYKLSKEKDEDILLEKSLKLQEKFEEICFKEHKELFKEKCGEYKYLEMVDMMYDFFMTAFIEKRAKQVNTINTSLKKIGNN